MSVIACKLYTDRIEIAADSQITRGATLEKREDAKIFQTNGIVIGGTGHAKDVALFHIFCKTRKPSSATEESLIEFYHEYTQWRKEKIDDEGDESSYLFVYDNRAFNLHEFYIKEITDYLAIGAGMDYALGALYLGHDVEKACETACELSIYCEKPINKYVIRREA